MSAAHTPGPWLFYTEPQPNGCPIVGAEGLMVAMLAHSIRHADQRETAIANARLIAAAPELLEALQRAERMLSDFQHLLGRQGARVDAVLDDTRAAIAKATGGAQ